MNIQEFALMKSIILDSSTSSSSSDENELIVDENHPINEIDDRDNPNEKRPRVQNFIETVIYRYSEKEFEEYFRMHQTTFDYLLSILRPHLEGDACGFGKQPIPPEKQLYVALYVLGTPDSYRSVVTKFDVGKATAWSAVHRVVMAICNFRNYFIQWPTEAETNATYKRIEEKYGFPKVLGAIDGTHVICNDKLEFIHCYVGLPGSVHDMPVFKYSGVQQRCIEEYFPQNSHLLGDSAYTVQKHVIVP